MVPSLKSPVSFKVPIVRAMTRARGRTRGGRAQFYAIHPWAGTITILAFAPEKVDPILHPGLPGHGLHQICPLVAMAAGWLLMGEPLTPLQCLAALAVAGGVGLSQMR